MVDKLTVLFVVIEVTLILAIGIISICMRNFLEPFHRGFFKNDQSLMHPYHSSTIPSTLMYLVGFLVPVAAMWVIETLHFKHHVEQRSGDKVPLKIILVHSLWNWFKVVGIFILGAGITHLLTNIPKYSIGRLRPHFFDVCDPDWSKVNDTKGYITADICLGIDQDLIREARLSFPSGHSSMSLYCATVFMIYLNKRFKWNQIKIARPLLQVLAFGMAFYTCLSRISDYKHHWSDVLAGAILGLITGFFIMHRMSEVVFIKSESQRISRSTSLPSNFLDYHSSRLATIEATSF
ncbi:unnamed protein product [Lymnaea stagnalis]|uniref:Phosphatidic acid phosphatase type 2/haloperoxidase domain-containing protein n=1 Tax=Lymnaea stagnalis TaxID=6523 RepID=A0AAV2HL20_LYMST